jgi:cytochrome P450
MDNHDDLVSSIVHGGQETTSSFLARFLSIISEHSAIQQKLRAELQEANAASHFQPGSSLFLTDCAEEGAWRRVGLCRN